MNLQVFGVVGREDEQIERVARRAGGEEQGRLSFYSACPAFSATAASRKWGNCCERQLDGDCPTADLNRGISLELHDVSASAAAGRGLKAQSQADAAAVACGGARVPQRRHKRERVGISIVPAERLRRARRLHGYVEP